MQINDLKPILSMMEYTERLTAIDQGYSFNEAGQSFNEVGVTFGGLYGLEGDHPKLDITDYKPL
jgi:hypothetical protein